MLFRANGEFPLTKPHTFVRTSSLNTSQIHQRKYLSILALFPLDGAIEMEIYMTPDLSEEEISALSKEHRGGYNTWAGALLHIADKSRPDISYTAMRLTEYNSNP